MSIHLLCQPGLEGADSWTVAAAPPMRPHLLYQLDLEGADSWTVAAECAALGDRTMLEDLQAGVKPAQAVALIYTNGELVNQWTREHIKAIWKATVERLPEWLYPAAKSTTHGYCYGSGWMTTRDTILKYSMADLPLDLGASKPIALSKSEIEKLRECCASRYPGIKLWHEKEARAMMERGLIAMPTGHTRRFFGLKREWKQGREEANHETLREWLASKPQYNTTYALKLALWRLWHDGENRRDTHSQECTSPVQPLSSRSWQPVREAVGMVTGNRNAAELVKEARWRRKR